MGFELPSALIGLLLVGGPLLAHLVRRRDLPETKLPTVRFLARAVAESQRRRRVTNLLLLLLRMAAVALAALGVAAPYVLVPVAEGDGQRTALAIVLDDSRSMNAAGEGGTLLELAVARAQRAVDALPEGSTVTVVLSGAPPRVVLRGMTDLRAASSALASVATESARSGELPEAVALATQALHTAPPGVRRLVVLSDFAEHERPSEIRWPEDGIAVEPIALRATSRINRRVFAADRTIDPNDPEVLRVRAQVLADGSEPSVHVRLERDGAVLDERDVALADGSGTVVLSARIERTEGARDTAAREATHRIDGGDALAADDAAAVLLRAPEGTRVLLVNGDPRPMPTDDEVGFAVRAIGLGEGGAAGGFRARVVDPGVVGVSDLEWADVVVLANVDLAPGRFADQLARAVEGGTGLLVTGGDRVRPSALEAALGELLPARLEAASTATDGPGLFASTADGDRGAAAPGLANAHVRRRNALDPRIGAATVELRFADGSPALVSADHGRGRVAVLAVPLDDDFGDLPYRPGYLPLLARLLASLSGGLGAASELAAPGTEIDLSRFTRLGSLSVVFPSGRRHTLSDEGDGVLRDAAEAGVYRVVRGGREIPEAAFVVQAPLAESDLASEGAPEVGDGRAATASGGTLKRPLGPTLFALAAALFALEGLLRQGLALPRRRPRAASKGDGARTSRAPAAAPPPAARRDDERASA